MARNRVIGRAARSPGICRRTSAGSSRPRWAARCSWAARRSIPSAARCRAGSASSSRAAGSSRRPDVVAVPRPRRVPPEDYAPREVWVAGGAEIYRQTLARCTELYLSLLDREAEGDTFFPPFEADFELRGTVLQKPGFEVRRYVEPEITEFEIPQAGGGADSCSPCVPCGSPPPCSACSPLPGGRLAPGSRRRPAGGLRRRRARPTDRPAPARSRCRNRLSARNSARRSAG